jgi:hypothetical protein
MHCKDIAMKILTYVFPEKELLGLNPNVHTPHSCIYERFIYSHDLSAYSAAGK